MYKFSDDPVVSVPIMEEGNQQNHPCEAEDADADADVATEVCGCNACPDLTEEEFSKCCQSVKKAREKCLKEATTCICESQKLNKLLDKVRPSF